MTLQYQLVMLYNYTQFLLICWWNGIWHATVISFFRANSGQLAKLRKQRPFPVETKRTSGSTMGYRFSQYSHGPSPIRTVNYASRFERKQLPLPSFGPSSIVSSDRISLIWGWAWHYCKRSRYTWPSVFYKFAFKRLSRKTHINFPRSKQAVTTSFAH